ncbi:hypothetical protein ACWEO4_42790 [Streptomyces sp. NPDC004393]
MTRRAATAPRACGRSTTVLPKPYSSATPAGSRHAFSSDGTLLATTGHDQTVRLWQVPTGRPHCTLRVAGDLNGIAWHPDTTLLHA